MKFQQILPNRILLPVNLGLHEFLRLNVSQNYFSKRKL